MINTLFTTEVITVIAEETMWDGPLYPEETQEIKKAVLKRQREYSAGRLCAKKALTELGIFHFPIVADKNRAPIWPTGIVGSISHCDGFCGVAIARSGTILGIGLDIEVAGPLDTMIVDLVCTAKEQEWGRNTPPPMWSDWGKVMFSAKESVYKALFPSTQLPLEFRDVELCINHIDLTFSAQLSPQFQKKITIPICGRISIDEQYVYTGVVLRTQGN